MISFWIPAISWRNNLMSISLSGWVSVSGYILLWKWQSNFDAISTVVEAPAVDRDQATKLGFHWCVYFRPFRIVLFWCEQKHNACSIQMWWQKQWVFFLYVPVSVQKKKTHALLATNDMEMVPQVTNEWDNGWVGWARPNYKTLSAWARFLGQNRQQTKKCIFN